ncbi:MAG: class I SAM-dependent methyltransferase [Verrucomicrobiota bacterium]
MRRVLKFIFYQVYHCLSFIWLKLDRLASWGETRFWIDNVPDAIFTPATYCSYAGWIHNQGFFSALLSIYLEKENPNILDFGCGMGNLAPVCHYFVRNGGKFLGIDLDTKSIAACHKTYCRLTNCSFYLTKDKNRFYTPQSGLQKTEQGIDWPVNSQSQDLVIAMSVFTHLQESEAIRYLQKIHDVLVDDGLAIISFLVVRDYVNTKATFNFTHPLTPGWFTSKPACPETAIGLSESALLKLVTPKFRILRHLEGRVTGGKGPSLQDIFILRKMRG